MPVTTIEGIVQNGQVRLPDSVRLRDETKVLVIVPDPAKPIRIMSPRLVHPEQAADFVVEVTPDTGHANL